MSDFVPMTREEIERAESLVEKADASGWGLVPTEASNRILRTALAYLDRAERAEQEAARERARAEKGAVLARLIDRRARSLARLLAAENTTARPEETDEQGRADLRRWREGK